MRRLAATTGRLLLAAATLSSATVLAAVPAGAATARHASSGWGSPTAGHGSTFGQPATAGPVSSNANLNAWTADGDVKASIVRDGVLYIGGKFTHLVSPDGHSTIAAQHVAALNAATGQPINGFTAVVDDGEVDAMKLSADRSKIYIGGAFTHSGGSFAGHVMAIDPVTGARDTSWHGSTSWPVYSIAVSGARVYVGGGPDHIVASTLTASYLMALNAAGGGAAAGFTPPLIDNEPYHTKTPNASDGWITALAISTDGQQLYVGGYFNRVAGAGRPGLVALSTSTGAWNKKFAPRGVSGGAAHEGNDVLDLLPTPQHLYVAVGGRANLLFDFDPWVGGNTRFLNRADGDFQGITLIGRMLYLGGHFHNFVSDSTGYHYNGMTVRGSVVNITFAARVDAYSGLLDASWHPRVGRDETGANDYFGTYTMTTDGHNLYAGGAFSKVNAQVHPHVAIFPGP
jgi:hypothetical protein